MYSILAGKCFCSKLAMKYVAKMYCYWIKEETFSGYDERWSGIYNAGEWGYVIIWVIDAPPHPAPQRYRHRDVEHLSLPRGSLFSLHINTSASLVCSRNKWLHPVRESALLKTPLVACIGCLALVSFCLLAFTVTITLILFCDSLGPFPSFASLFFSDMIISFLSFELLF